MSTPTSVNGQPFYETSPDENILGTGVRLEPGAGYPPFLVQSPVLSDGRYRVRFIGATSDEVAYIGQKSSASSSAYPLRSGDMIVLRVAANFSGSQISVLFTGSFGFVNIVPIDGN